MHYPSQRVLRLDEASFEKHYAHSSEKLMTTARLFSVLIFDMISTKYYQKKI